MQIGTHQSVESKMSVSNRSPTHRRQGSPMGEVERVRKIDGRDLRLRTELNSGRTRWMDGWVRARAARTDPSAFSLLGRDPPQESSPVHKKAHGESARRFLCAQARHVFQVERRLDLGSPRARAGPTAQWSSNLPVARVEVFLVP